MPSDMSAPTGYPRAPCDAVRRAVGLSFSRYRGRVFQLLGLLALSALAPFAARSEKAASSAQVLTITVHSDCADQRGVSLSMGRGLYFSIGGEKPPGRQTVLRVPPGRARDL